MSCAHLDGFAAGSAFGVAERRSGTGVAACGRRRRGPRSAPNTLRRQPNSVGFWGRCRRGRGRGRAPSGMWPRTCRTWRGCSRPALDSAGVAAQHEAAAAAYTQRIGSDADAWWSWRPTMSFTGSWWRRISLGSTPFRSRSTRPTTCGCGCRPRPPWALYQAASGAALASAPRTAAAPIVLTPGAGEAERRRRGPEPRAGAGRRLRFGAGRLEHHHRSCWRPT